MMITDMKKSGLLLIAAGMLCAGATAQTPTWADPAVTQQNREPARTTFMSYGNGENAVTFDYSKSEFYVPLNGKWDFRLASAPQSPEHVGEQIEIDVPGYFATNTAEDYAGLKPPALPAVNQAGHYQKEIEIPVFWLDRDIFFRVEGLKGGLTLYVNGVPVGYAEESGTPVEFNISPYVEDGTNTINMIITQRKTGDWLENGTLSGAGIEGGVYLYSQYRIHINDFEIKTSFDSLKNTTGVLDLAIEVVNNFNFPDSITVYYDLRDAQGKPVRYNTRETVVPGFGGRDTVRFEGKLADVRKWSPESPYLYQLVLRIRYQGRFTEYIPYWIGFRDLEMEDGVYLLNEKPLVIKGKDYNYTGITSDDRTMRAELQKIKQEGYNAIRCGYHPRKARLYELCDELGLLVCDEVNLDTSLTGQRRDVGGTLANEPAWAEAYLQRMENAWRFSRNYTGVMMYSLGKGPGVGYNIYKSYLRMKELEPLRPVIYEAAGAVWCNDPQSWQGGF